ncbi:hypothetical protein [Ferrimonas marina]|uniref:Uncharacterized protein n=1 Tax=Ferrimonas marina TaxID=299255 RepID=A0A1M5ZLE8_9GAMM|nr:hypothetical protein [Ferrimonas marina]SHI25014.1 hypothetical protein SAMN02745129_0412 [Ferrimonas marina]
MPSPWLLVAASLLAANNIPIKEKAEQASEIEDPVTEQEQRWFDKAHTLLSSRGQTSAAWFDAFFGPSDAADQADAWFRLRLQQQMLERESNSLKLRVSAAYHLPKTREQLKLLIESDEDSELSNLRDLDDDSSEASTRAALRWTPLDYRVWDLSFDLGVSLNSGLDPFARTRARYFHSLDDRTVLRLSQELKAESRDGLSETTRVVWERLYDDHGYRVSSRARFGESTDGLEWSLTAAHGVKLTERSAMSVFFTFSGATRDEEEESEIVRFGANYRRNFLRSWLFYEVEPQLTYPKKFDYQPNWELRLTLESQFGSPSLSR